MIQRKQKLTKKIRKTKKSKFNGINLTHRNAPAAFSTVDVSLKTRPALEAAGERTATLAFNLRVRNLSAPMAKSRKKLGM